MARRPRPLAPGLLYHVIARGNHRQKTFFDQSDYHAYLDRLAKYCQQHQVRLYAYCLMPNHVHLLVETGAVPLSKFMQSLQQSYTQAFNRRHRKVGHLFQGRYHAIVCEKDRYLLALVRYIHLNPVRAGLVRQPDRYAYSGHRAYLMGHATAGLDPTLVLRMLGGRAAYQRFVRGGMEEGHKDEYYQVEDQRFLGTKEFTERLKAEAHEPVWTRRPTHPVHRVLKAVAGALDRSPAELASPDRSWQLSRARVLVAYTLVRRLGYRLTEVAAALGRDAATVSALLSRVAARLPQDNTLRREIERLEKIVKT